MNFTCPRDDVALVTLRERGKVCHQCPDCRGYAVTIALLRRLIPREYANQLWNDARIGSASRGVSCPACRETMHAVLIPRGDETGSIEVDVCRACQLIWLDEGEVEAAPQKPAGPEPEALSLEAREALARIQLESRRERAEIQEMADVGRYGPTFPGLDSPWKKIPWILGLPVETGGKPLTRVPIALAAVSLLIATVSIAVFFLVPPEDWVGGDTGFFDRYGFVPARWDQLGGMTSLTAFFLHAGIFHLIGNLYFLFLAGDDVEDRVGPWRFLLLLFAAAIGGDLLHLAGEWGSTVPAVGASGGISGVLAYWALGFPGKRIHLLSWFGFYPVTLRFSARVAFFFWIAMQLFIAWMQMEGVSSVSGLAHLGGAAVGVAFFIADRSFASRIPTP